MEKNETLSNQSNKGYASEIELFRSLAGDPDAVCLKGLIDQVASGIEDGVSPIVLSPNSDKAHRTVSFDFFLNNMCLYLYIFIFYIMCESNYVIIKQPIFLRA